jgi:hypothetical protein
LKYIIAIVRRHKEDLVWKWKEKMEEGRRHTHERSGHLLSFRSFETLNKCLSSESSAELELRRAVSGTAVEARRTLVECDRDNELAIP